MFFVLYHAPCLDGATSALMASLYFERIGVDPCDKWRVSWHPMKVFLPAEEQFKASTLNPGDEVFILDYSGSVDFVRTLAARAKSVTVLDHHLTALETFSGLTSLPSNLILKLDMFRSGASLALDYFTHRYWEEKSQSLPPLLTDAIRPVASPDEFVEVPEPNAASVPQAPAAVVPLVAAAETRSAKRRRKKAVAKSVAAQPGDDAVAVADSHGQVPRLGAAATRSCSAYCIGRGYTGLLGEGPDGAVLLKLVRYVEDADLYRWWMADSREFHAGLGSLRMNFDAGSNKDLFSRLRSLDHAQLIEQGRKQLVSENRRIEEEMGRTFRVTVPELGIKCLGVRTSWPEMRSALGHKLAEKSQQEGLTGLGVVAYSTAELERKGYIKVSVRALGGEDTLKLTEKFGGGGHKAASSCNVLKFVFDTWCEDPLLDLMTRASS